MNQNNTEEISVEKLMEYLISSLEETYIKDAHLYENNLCERSLTFHLGLIMYSKRGDFGLGDYDVDSEYNKNGELQKVINSKVRYPDLIIHKRGKNPNNNLLVIEIKKGSRYFKREDFDNDVAKLKFLTENEDYQYKLGAHVCLDSNNFIIKWYLDGKSQNGFYLHDSTLNFENNNFIKKYGKIDIS